MTIASTVRLFLPAFAALALQVPAAAQSAKEAAASKSSPGLVVGVVDVVRAVEQYPLYIKLRAELDQSMQGYDQQLKEMSARLDELRGTIQVLAEGSQERADKEFEFQMLLQTQDYRKKAFRTRVTQEDLRNTLRVYEDLEYVVGVVARRKGVSMVLTVQDVPPSAQPIEDLAMTQVQARVGAYERRQVWFAAEELDLTGDVIKQLMIPVPDRNSPERAPKSAPAGKE